MVKRQRTRWEVQGTGLLVAMLWALSAQAIYLDEQQNINLRARVYSQAAIRTDKSSTDTFPTTKQGQLVQHRNFYNPELDAKLTPYTSWMRDGGMGWLEPDDLRFRGAAWGVYDGIYDYGANQFNRNQRRVNQNFGRFAGGICSQDFSRQCSSDADCQGAGICKPSGTWFLEAPTINVPAGCPGGPGACLVDSLQQLTPGAEVKNPRDIYAARQRINELYLSYSKGPVFFRIGRQSISWGEADTIALLDQNNPFDFTLAAPGLFMDLDEARIPLWTVRASLNLFDTLGPLSNGFVEAYTGQVEFSQGAEYVS